MDRNSQTSFLCLPVELLFTQHSPVIWNQPPAISQLNPSSLSENLTFEKLITAELERLGILAGDLGHFEGYTMLIELKGEKAW